MQRLWLAGVLLLSSFAVSWAREPEAAAYSHFALPGRAQGEVSMVVLATITPTGLDRKEVPGHLFPIAVVGGRCYGFGQTEAVQAMDLTTGVLTTIADRAWRRLAFDDGGLFILEREGEIRAYDLHTRAWRAVTKVKDTPLAGVLSPDRHWLAYFTVEDPKRMIGFCQLHLLDLDTGTSRPIGSPIAPYQHPIQRAQMYPEIAWGDNHRLLLLHSAGPRKSGDKSQDLFPDGVLAVVDTSGSFRDIKQFYHAYPDLKKFSFWSAPLVSESIFMKNSEAHYYTYDYANDRLVPAPSTVGDVRLDLPKDNPSDRVKLYYRDRLLGTADSLSHLAFSPDGRFLTWTEGRREAHLNCFDRLTGQTQQMPTDPYPHPPVTTWFRDQDLKAAPLPPVPEGWRRWEEK